MKQTSFKNDKGYKCTQTSQGRMNCWIPKSCAKGGEQ